MSFLNVNLFKIYCRKNSEKFSISIYNVSGEIYFNDKYNYKKEDVNVSDPKDKYNNTFSGEFYKKINSKNYFIQLLNLRLIIMQIKLFQKALIK